MMRRLDESNHRQPVVYVKPSKAHSEFPFVFCFIFFFQLYDWLE